MKRAQITDNALNLATILLLGETDEMPQNPAIDQLHRRWRQAERSHPFRGYYTDPVGTTLRWFERDTDASHRSLEGEPSPEERKREIAKTVKFDPVPRTPKNSVTMATNRNARRKSFGYPDHRYSMRDLKWPTDPSYHAKLREPLPEPPMI